MLVKKILPRLNRKKRRKTERKKTKRKRIKGRNRKKVRKKIFHCAGEANVAPSK